MQEEHELMETIEPSAHEDAHDLPPDIVLKFSLDNFFKFFMMSLL